MHPHLEKLMELQVIDYDLGELERSKDYLPDMMDNLRDEIKEAEQKLTDVGGRLEEAKIKQKQLELEISDNRNIVVSSGFMTSQAKVFAAGDACNGASLVVTAIHSGRKAAEAIQAFLRDL